MCENNTEVSMNKIYDEIIKSKTELKLLIEASETRILMKIELLKNRVTEVEKENNLLKRKIEQIERNSKKNNIVLFGISSENINAEIISQELNKLLGVNLNATDINDAYKLGRSENSPVKVEFISYQKKQLVLQNCNKLRGTSVTVTHDQTETQRTESKLLRKYLKDFKQNTSRNCYIKRNKLYVDEKIYTLEDLRQIDSITELVARSVSAPATPQTPGKDCDNLLFPEQQPLHPNLAPPEEPQKVEVTGKTDNTPKTSTSTISGNKEKVIKLQGLGNQLIKEKLRNRGNSVK